jgi:protocatechuate 3,4-dioxygenase beta subunit/5-hydroxyisourate hydrolase-like protein (transthyretin family)
MSEKMRMGLIVVCLVMIAAFIWYFNLREDSVKPKYSSPPEQVQQPAAKAASANTDAMRGTRTPRTTPSRTQEAADSRPSDGTGFIQGKVRMVKGGSFPADLVVNLYRSPDGYTDYSARDRVLGTAGVQDNGSFSFTDLSYRGYTLIASAEGYTGSTFRMIYEDRPQPEVQILLYPSRFMSGTVTDTRGAGVPNANVYVNGLRDQGKNIQLPHSNLRAIAVSTNERGEFHLNTITNRYPDGEFRLAAAADGFALNYTEMLPLGTSGIKIVLEDAGSISGRVVHRDSGEPLPNAELVARGDDYLLLPIQTDTDDDGAFTLTGLATGKYQLVLTDKQVKITGATRDIELAANESIQDLIVEVSEGALLSGRVYDADTDKGISGVKIMANPRGVTYSGPVETVTDGTGHYSFAGLYEAQYRISHDGAPGYPRSHRDDDQKVATSLDKPITDVDFLVSKGISISGTVVDEKGEPVVDASVSGQADSGVVSDRQKTDANGDFVLTGFQTHNTVNLRVGDSMSRHGRVAIKIVDSGVSGVKIRLESAASISGTLVYSTGEPVFRQRLIARDSRSNGAPQLGFAHTTIKGEFSFGRLRSGTYIINTQDRFGSTESEKTLTTVTVEKGHRLENLRLVIPGAPARKVTISGTITDDTGAPAEGVRVSFDAMKGNDSSTGTNPSTSADGRYVIEVREGMDYRLSFSSNDHVSRNLENIPAGSTSIDVTLKRSGWITGTITDAATGEPIPSFALGLQHGPIDLIRQIYYRDYYHGKGAFELDDANPDRTAVIYARVKGYADQAVEVGRVNPGETLDGIRIEMQAPFNVTGRVTDGEGNPVNDAWIYRGEVPWSDMDGHLKAADTDADGQFELHDLPGGEHMILTKKPGFVIKETAVDLQQRVTQVDIVLGGGASITGIVTLAGEPVENARVSGMIPRPNHVAGAEDIEVQTDGDGRFQDSGLWPGFVKIYAQIITGDRDKMMTQEIELVDDMEMEINFPIGEYSGVIEGFLLEKDGTPASGLVMLEVTKGSESEGGTLETSGDGAYRFDRLPPGQFRLQAIVDFDDTNPKFVQGELRDGETRNVDIVLGAGATLAVKLPDYNGENVVIVSLLPAGTEIPQSTAPEDFTQLMSMTLARSQAVNGVAVFDQIEPGEYVVLALGLGNRTYLNAHSAVTIVDESPHEAELSL